MQKKYTSKIKINQVEVGFTKKNITAYGGFSMIAQFLGGIKFREFIENAVPIKELSGNGTGIFSKIISYLLTILAGGTRFSHILYLGESEEILKKLFGVKRLIKAGTSLTRFFKKIKSWQAVEILHFHLWDYTNKIIPWSKIKDDYISFDSSVITRYGRQEGAKKGYNPKKRGRRSHHPLISFLNGSRYVVNLWNRAGNAFSSENIVEFAGQTFKRLEGLVNILGVLADSSFYDIKFIQFLESLNRKYIIAVKFYSNIQSKLYSHQQWKKVTEDIEVCEFMFRHREGCWDRDRRYFAIRRRVEKNREKDAVGKQLTLFPLNELTLEYRYSVYITNYDDDILDLWRLYRSRIDDENRIKELKEDFGLEGFSMYNFYATEAAMLIRVLLYNIYNLFRHEILGKSEHNIRAGSFRFKYLVIPAISGRRGNQAILRLGIKSKSMRAKIQYLLSRINQWIPPVEHIMQCI